MKPGIVPYRPGTEFFTEELCHITELSNSARDEGLSIALARVEPGVTTRWHRLLGISERYLIVAGQGLVEIADLAPEAVGPADVVIIPPGCRQRITNIGAEDLVFYALCTPRFRASAYEDLEQDDKG
jgi:mannose-6-phosphate isomerase-like protein (cupin superfamily)